MNTYVGFRYVLITKSTIKELYYNFPYSYPICFLLDGKSSEIKLIKFRKG